MTGSASWLVRHLVSKYSEAYNVVSFDKLDYCSSLHNTRMLEGRPNFRFFHGDCTQPDDVLKCLQRHQIDTVFHLAAQSHVDLSFGNAFNFWNNNVLGTGVLLESIKEVGSVRRFYHISTDEVHYSPTKRKSDLLKSEQVYGEVEKDADDLTEHSTLDPTNPYAASKASAEMMVKAYVYSFGLRAVIIRLNNVYGPHQVRPRPVIECDVC